MESKPSAEIVSPERPAHRRNKSSQVLKSILPRSRNPSTSPKKGTTSTATPIHGVEPYHDRENSNTNGSHTTGHPHIPSRVLGELDGANAKPSSQKNKKNNQHTQIDDPFGPSDAAQSPRKTSKAHFYPPKEKENTTPPRQDTAPPHTPIWAQFASQPSENSHMQQNGEYFPDHIQYAHDDQFGKVQRSPAKAGQFYAPGQSPVRSPGEALLKAREGAETKLRLASNMQNKGNPINQSNNTRITLGTTQASPKKSKVLETAAKFDAPQSGRSAQSSLLGKDLDNAFEAVLVGRNVPEKQRQNMRGLDPRVKQELIKHDNKMPSIPAEKDRSSSKSFWDPIKSRSARSKTRKDEDSGDNASLDDDDKSTTPSKRGRSRGRTFTFTKKDRSQSRRARSNSRPRSLMSLKNLSSSSVDSIGKQKTSTQQPTSASHESAEEYVSYLKSESKPENFQVGRIHKLRLLLRNETISWIESFIERGGMTSLIDLIRRTMKLEWREEHEDMLMFETLSCIRGLCTTERALAKLDEVQGTLFPELLKMLFDEERKGPAEFNTRGTIISLLFIYLSTASADQFAIRSRSLLSHLKDPTPPEDERPLGFIEQMRQPRPYLIWCKEVTEVTKEVFWIFLHHVNVVHLIPNSEIPSKEANDPRSVYTARHFPRDRPPVPAAPHVGGVEWEATNYLASHVDLLNGLIASLPTKQERNSLREDLRVSGFEKMLGSLRLCKEKFYGCVHDGLRTWVAAAAEDGWDVKDVRQGASSENAPKLDFDVGGQSHASPGKVNAGNASPQKESEKPLLDLPVWDAVKAEGWLD